MMIPFPRYQQMWRHTERGFSAIRPLALVAELVALNPQIGIAVSEVFPRMEAFLKEEGLRDVHRCATLAVDWISCQGHNCLSLRFCREKKRTLPPGSLWRFWSQRFGHAQRGTESPWHQPRVLYSHKHIGKPAEKCCYVPALARACPRKQRLDDARCLLALLWTFSRIFLNRSAGFPAGFAWWVQTRQGYLRWHLRPPGYPGGQAR